MGENEKTFDFIFTEVERLTSESVEFKDLTSTELDEIHRISQIVNQIDQPKRGTYTLT